MGVFKLLLLAAALTVCCSKQFMPRKILSITSKTFEEQDPLYILCRNGGRFLGFNKKTHTVGDPEKGWFWAESKNLAHSVIGYHHRHLIREKMTLKASVFEKCANTSPWGPKWAFRPNFQVFGCKIQFSGNKLAYIIIFVDDNLYLSVKEYHWTYNHNFWAL